MANGNTVKSVLNPSEEENLEFFNFQAFMQLTNLGRRPY